MDYSDYIIDKLDYAIVGPFGFNKTTIGSEKIIALYRIDEYEEITFSEKEIMQLYLFLKKIIESS